MNITGTYKTQHGELVIAQHFENITATYQENGICSGKLQGNKVTGIWKNKGGQGVFEWEFSEPGKFTGKYKSGLEDGPMKGKWNGVDVNWINDSVRRVVKIEIHGKGGEIVVGDISDFQANLNDAFDDTEMDLQEILDNTDIRMHYEIPEWYEIDNLQHVNGAFIDDGNSCVLKIYDNEALISETKIPDLEDSSGNQILNMQESYFETDENTLFSGVCLEEGCLFSGIIELKKDEMCTLDLLTLHSKEIMINEDLIENCLYKIDYNGIEVENINFSSNSLGFRYALHS